MKRLSGVADPYKWSYGTQWSLVEAHLEYSPTIFGEVVVSSKMHIKVVGFGVSGSWRFVFATLFFSKNVSLNLGIISPQVSRRTCWENDSKPLPTRWFNVSFWSTSGGHLSFWKGHESPSSKRSRAELPGIRYNCFAIQAISQKTKVRNGTAMFQREKRETTMKEVAK